MCFALVSCLWSRGDRKSWVFKAFILFFDLFFIKLVVLKWPRFYTSLPLHVLVCAYFGGDVCCVRDLNVFMGVSMHLCPSPPHEAGRKSSPPHEAGRHFMLRMTFLAL